MKKDRLRKDRDDVHNLEDLIDARSERTSHIADDRDAYGRDVDIPDETDVEEALTFPHPKRRDTEDIELMDTPNKDDMEEDEDDLDMQPTDYEGAYDRAESTYAVDDKDGVVEDQIHQASYIRTGEISDEEETEIMPKKFVPDQKTKDMSDQAEREK